MTIYTSVGKLIKVGENQAITVKGIPYILSGLEIFIWESTLFSFKDFEAIAEKVKVTAKIYDDIEVTDVQIGIVLERLLGKGVIAGSTGKTYAAAVEKLFWRCHFVSTEIKMRDRVRAMIYGLISGHGIRTSLVVFEGILGSNGYLLGQLKMESNMESYLQAFVTDQRNNIQCTQREFKNKVLSLYSTRNVIVDHVLVYEERMVSY